MTNHIFFTQNNQQAATAALNGRTFTQMEQLVRQALRYSHRSLILSGLDRHQEARSVDILTNDKTIERIRTLSEMVSSKRSSLPSGIKRPDDMQELAYLAAYGRPAELQTWATIRYPNAIPKNELKGMDRAFADAVPNCALAEVAKFFKKFQELYRHYSHLSSPFMVDINGRVQHATIREYAIASGDNRFFGMMANKEWDEKLRLLLEPSTFIDAAAWADRDGFMDRAEQNSSGVMLGLMMAYLSATNNGDKSAGLTGYPRDNIGEKIVIDDKFYMTVAELKQGHEAHHYVTFGEFDKQQMLFVVHPTNAEVIKTILTYSKL